ncbi:MAG: T9SS type A sorting domain-containing protein [Psychroflexus sp.]|nr:T9SS type A sorting domain-containing protein [Psychroflexus sp.]
MLRELLLQIILAGGLVGYCTMAFGPNRINTINNSYSRANITATTGRAGGLFGGGDAALVIMNSYATGTVSAPEFEGGFIGAYGGGDIIISNSYFDTESSGLTEGVGGFTGPTQSYEITGKTTGEMKTEAFVSLLNAESEDAPWSINPDQNDGYPAFDSYLSTSQPENIALALDIYPTVVDNQINVSSELELEAFRIYNYSGQMVSEGNLKNNKTISANGLSAGVYLLNINTTEGTVTKKFIKK